MSSRIRTFGVATLIALAFALIPASVAPTGGLEINGLCASADCERSLGSVCFQESGPPLWGYKLKIG